MKSSVAALCLFLFISSCRNVDKLIVSSTYADSLITNYTLSLSANTSNNNLAFWKQRMDSLPDNFVNGPEYGSALSSRFHIFGDIHDLAKADSLFHRSTEANQEKEPGNFRTLASVAMLRHRFQEADSFLRRAIKIDGHSVPNTFLDFDITFELGQYPRAKNILNSLKADNSYGYLFRRSKFEHYTGNLDSSISCMMQAAEKAGNNNYLRQVALSNAADLNIHKGDLKEACKLYQQSISIDAADFHSIMGLGWIALVHDKNDSLAKKIFQFVRGYNKSPDALLKLELAAETRADTGIQKRFAIEFASQANDSVYGKMYSKYLIGLYTSILNEPAKAVILAEQEINNRPASQVFAWYAWSLFCNNQKDKAYNIYKGYVSGKPLEGLELYYMGKLMKGLDKGYNAEQFFKAAYKNRYDLSPAQLKDLQENLE